MLHGSGTIGATRGAFTVAARFPSLRGEPPGTTTPEELLAASHAAIGRTVEQECTISTAIRGSVEISYDITSR